MTYAINCKPSDHLPTFILPRCHCIGSCNSAQHRVLSAASLLDVCTHLYTTQPEHKLKLYRVGPAAQGTIYPDFHNIKRQSSVKRALEIAAVGFNRRILHTDN